MTRDIVLAMPIALIPFCPRELKRVEKIIADQKKKVGLIFVQMKVEHSRSRDCTCFHVISDVCWSLTAAFFIGLNIPFSILGHIEHFALDLTII